MTTPTLSAAPRTAPRTGAARGTAVALIATAVVLTLNGAALGPLMMFDARPYSQLAAEPAHLIHYVVWTAALVALSQIYPRLGGVTGPDGRTIPAWVLVLASTGVVLDACARFLLAFVNPFLAAREPHLLDVAPDAILLVPSLGAGVVAMIGTVALGVAGWRARVFPRIAVVVLVVGAVAIPAIGPLSNLLVGAALAWIGVALLRNR